MFNSPVAAEVDDMGADLVEHLRALNINNASIASQWEPDGYLDMDTINQAFNSKCLPAESTCPH